MTTFLQARGSQLSNQDHPPAIPLPLQALGRLWLTTSLQEEEGRDQDQSLHIPASAAALSRVYGEGPRKEHPEEKVPNAEIPTRRRTSSPGGDHHLPLQGEDRGGTSLCQGPPVSGRTVPLQGTTGPSPSPLLPSRRRRKRRRSSCLPFLDCTGPLE